MANLRPELKGEDGTYNLTGCTGSFPYMAPVSVEGFACKTILLSCLLTIFYNQEVAQCQSYNCSADVFSFGILLWEILSLKKAFGGISTMTRLEYYNRVLLLGERPPLNNNWPPLTRQSMQEAWAANPKGRPNVKRVAGLIRSDLTDMSHDDKVVHRTVHMQRRSMRSMVGMRGSSSEMFSAKEQHNGYSVYDDVEA